MNDFELTNEPQYHRDCCLSLSQVLFRNIANLIRYISNENHAGTLVVSIGCGTGFFEGSLSAFLRKQGLNNIHIEGVEVHTATVPYLSKELVHHVHGSWSTCARAEDAHILVFVYPRQGQLVKQYLEQFHQTVHMMLWLGPYADWIEQQGMLHNIASFDNPHILQNAGLASYEIAVIFKNKLQVSTKKGTQPPIATECAAKDIVSI